MTIEKNNYEREEEFNKKFIRPIHSLRARLGKYRSAYNILMDYWENIPDDDKPVVHEKLKKLGL